VRGRVGIVQSVASDELGHIESSGQLRQGLDATEIVLLGESPGLHDTQLFPHEEVGIESHRSAFRVLRQRQEGSAPVSHLSALDH
jgi:hypothetical protein